MNLIKMDGFFHPSQAKGAVHIIGCGAVGSSIAFILAHCGVTNFVLYDDAETIRQKIRIGHEMGLCAAFLMYPEVKDLLPALFSRQRNG